MADAEVNVKPAANPAPEPKPAPGAAWHARFGNWAQIASAVIAAFGFAIVIIQIHGAARRAIQDELRAELTDARKLYMSYSDATLKYPALSSPDYDALMKNHVEYLRYENFVSHMIYAYDDILNIVKQYGNADEEKLWVMSFNLDLEPHLRYLCQISDPRVFQTFRPEMQQRLSDALKQGCKDMKPLVEQK
jgi:hypothetical protein